MCIAKCIDHIFLTEPRRNVVYILTSCFIFSIAIATVYLIDEYKPIYGDIKDLTTVFKMMLVQLPFLILLSISISMCCINAFILKCKNGSSMGSSDLTEAELQLRNTVEDLISKYFVLFL